MKKKIIFAATAVFMAAAVSVFTYISSERNAMDELFSANVEALANTEAGNCGLAAYEYDDDWYEDCKYFRRCGDCEWVKGSHPHYNNC